MTTASVSDATITGNVQSPVGTGAADNQSLAGRNRQEREYRQGWQKLIDAKLIEWGRNPAPLEEDDLIPPSPAIVDRAAQVAMRCRDEGVSPPDSVVPNGDGGIVFEISTGNLVETLEIHSDGSREYITYEDCRVVRRERFP